MTRNGHPWSCCLHAKIYGSDCADEFCAGLVPSGAKTEPPLPRLWLQPLVEEMRWNHLRLGRRHRQPARHAVHASIHNHFNHDRYLKRRDIFKQNRCATLAEWRQLAA
jgi:hypothetical protein